MKLEPLSTLVATVPARFSVQLWSTALASLFIAACAAPAEPPRIAVISSPVIYGEDDRREVYEANDGGVKELARSVAVIIPRDRVTKLADGTLRTSPVTEGESLDFCQDPPFSNQPALAICTAALVDEDLLVTAGHCFENTLDCANYWFAFGYYYESPGNEGLPQSLELYECEQVIVRGVGPTALDPTAADYAVVQLSKKVRDRAPLELRENLQKGEPLTVLSATTGVPLKVDRGARVLANDPSSDHFVLDSDTFQGSSGAPVLDAAGALAGILVRGNSDFSYDAVGRCFTLNYRPEPDGVFTLDAGADSGARGDAGSATLDAGSWLVDGGAGSAREASDGAVPGSSTGDSGTEPNAEEATYIARAIAALCERGYPSQRLCGIAPRCGDSFCANGEDSQTCPKDCWALANTALPDAATPDAATGSFTDANVSGLRDAGADASEDAKASQPSEPTQAAGCAIAHAESSSRCDPLALVLGALLFATRTLRRRRTVNGAAAT